MQNTIIILQIIIGIALSGLILLQAKGVGLGRSFGGQMYHSKRGLENIVFRSTIILSVLFVGLSVLGHVIS